MPREALESFDARDFEREISAAKRALVRRVKGETEHLESALALFRGDLLDGESVGD